MIANFIDKMYWTRSNPTLLHPSRYTFIAIKKFIEDTVCEFKKEAKGDLHVLDFWCGNQPYKYIFSNDRYNWCDIGDSPEFNNGYVVIKESDPLPYGKESMDIILCTEVLEHLENPRFYAEEFYRILKDDWILILTVPQIWDFHPYPRHYFLYTPDGIDLHLWDKFEIEFFWDTTPTQTGALIAMMYFETRIPLWRPLVNLMTNLFVLLRPKYRKYNHATSHIFAKCIKKKNLVQKYR